MVRENARTAEQLKASQEQMARAIANASVTCRTHHTIVSALRFVGWRLRDPMLDV